MTNDKQVEDHHQIKIIFDSVSYDPLTGILTWKKYINSRAVKGSKAGSERKNRKETYIRRSINKKSYFAHRIAWLLFYGKFPNGSIDHIDGNGINNSISNLRDVTTSENRRNSRIAETNKTGVCGVFFNKQKNKYESKIKVNYKTIHLALTNDFFLAVCARKSAEKRYGFHENHGSVRNT
jgi:hypothetical protein